jgi:hypothetical protein
MIDLAELAKQCGLVIRDQPMLGTDKLAALVAEHCANLAETAEPYQAADLIRKEFGLKPPMLFDDWGGWK